MAGRWGWLLLVALVGGGFALGYALERVQPSAAGGCGGCHAAGREPGHPALGCEACHLGNAASAVKQVAHLGLVKLPGQLADAPRTCGAVACHPDAPARLAANVMTTMNGVVSVDRWVFGEQATPTAVAPIGGLTHSPADSHLRNLCASCHLGTAKIVAGPIGEQTRGGGCLACHLDYDWAALADLDRRDGGLPTAHAKISGAVSSMACFGCHSRSGRVSLNFEGWLDMGEADAGVGSRTLLDGRHLRRATEDVHSAAGFGCVDCHGAREVMGDGRAVLHREEQRVVSCSDCHPEGPARSTTPPLDELSQRVLARLGLPSAPVVLAARGDVPLPGVQLDADGGVRVWLRAPAKFVSAPRPAPACARSGLHGRLSCQSCHDAWAPTCVTCHTRYDDGGVMFDLLSREEAPGSWEEQGAVAEALPPTLGETIDGGIVTVSPGMIFTLEHRGVRAFRRLFAPVSAHTTARARSCESCHRDPLALGFGRGAFHFTAARGGLAAVFEAGRPIAPDGLPDDAWIAPWSATGDATREWLSPLRITTQRRVLAVGACLTCHGSDAGVFRKPLSTGSPACQKLK